LNKNEYFKWNILEHSRLYRTGDFGSIQDGILYYEGRTDSQVKIRGHRVDLSEIEKALGSLSYIRDKIVLCHRAGDLEQTLLGFVVLNGNENLRTEQEIENDLRNIVIDYMVPKVVILNTFPLLVNGKIDRQSLLKNYKNSFDSRPKFQFDYSGVPENKKKVAKELFEVIASVTGKFELSFNSNFYEIGGNSLNSIHTIMKLKEKGFFISISNFIGAENLGEIIEKISCCADESLKQDLSVENNLKFTCHSASAEYKEIAVKMLGEGFFQKGGLVLFIKGSISVADYIERKEKVWDKCLRSDLSFVVKDSAGEIVGVSMNYDEHFAEEIFVTSNLKFIVKMCDFLEATVK
jgi:hypothetical protein